MPFGPLELIVILVIALLILGPGKLPEVGASLGKSIREFRKASSDLQDSVRIDASPAPPQGTPQQPPASVQPAPPPAAAPSNTVEAAPPAGDAPSTAPAAPASTGSEPVATGHSASADPTTRPD